MTDWSTLFQGIKKGDKRSLARTISLVENEVSGYIDFLEKPHTTTPKIIGITGPPGAGKSSLTDKLIGEILTQKKTIGVICIDPSSPFHLGAILGDRLRMAQWYLNPNVFIRSLASRGALGGLNPKIIEIVEVMKHFHFDYIIIETVGVGQSEIDIVGLADITTVVLVPEAGDEIQTMKAGLMEIADIFVVNKCDRPTADTFFNNLKLKLSPAFSNHPHIQIIKTSTTHNIGIPQFLTTIQNLNLSKNTSLKTWTHVNKVFEIIQKHRMQNINKNHLFNLIKPQLDNNTFQLYQFVKPYLSTPYAN